MSNTAVPLPPVRKSGLVWLFLGIFLALAVAGWMAWSTTPKGITLEEVQSGSGANPSDADIVLVNYTGRLTDGTEFDKGEMVPFPVTGVVPGFSEGLKRMQKGGKYKLTIPPALGYGAEAKGDIPANSTLVFDVELIDFKSEAEVRAMQEEMMRQLGGPGGVPTEGAPPPPQPKPKGQ